MVAFAWKRAGRTYNLREEFRSKILHATKREISEAVKKHLLDQKGTLVSFLGKDLLKKENKKLILPLVAIEI